jgi:hypothetical protein
MKLLRSCAVFFFSLASCADSGEQGGAPLGGTGGGDTSEGGAPPAGGAPAQALDVLDGYLRGDMDNAAQVDDGFEKLVERHVCAIPGYDEPGALWLYVEHVEVLPNSDRDAYFTRVNEIREVDGKPVSKAYRFAESHPLYTDAFAFNGERDGCLDPELLGGITLADLEYREGCDVTFTEDGEVFHASTVEGACAFPGGYIHTTAVVFAEGLDTSDVAVIDGQETGDEFQFRKL